VTSASPLRTKNADGNLAPVDVTLAETAGGWAPKNALAPYTVASSSDGGVQFADSDLAVRPQGSAVPGVLEDSTVFYGGTQADTDTIVKSLDSGVELYWQLRSKDSPEELALDVTVPAGAGLTQPGPEGVKIVQGTKQVGQISPVIATDADGRPVKATLKVDGNRVLVEVPHRSADVRYPIMVDPTIAATFVFPYDGADAFNYWGKYAYPTVGSFAMPTEPGSGDPMSYWGNGLYIHNSGYPSTLGFTGGTYGSADRAGHYYTAPGQARIFQVDNSDSKNILGDNLAICMLVGIAKPNITDWDGPYGTTWGEGCTAFADFAWHMRVDPLGSGTPGNVFVFGVYAYSSGNWAFNDYFRDAVIYMDDADNPAITQVNAPDDEWINGDNTGSIRVFGSDPSTGVAKFDLATTGWNAEVTNPNCLYGPCSTPWDDGAAQTPVSSLPEGHDSISITASDPAGNVSSPATISLAVDHTGPNAATDFDATYDPASGQSDISWAQSVDPLLADSTPGSGVASYRYRYAVDGNQWSTWTETTNSDVILTGIPKAPPCRPRLWRSMSRATTGRRTRPPRWQMSPQLHTTTQAAQTAAARMHRSRLSPRRWWTMAASRSLWPTTSMRIRRRLLGSSRRSQRTPRTTVREQDLAAHMMGRKQHDMP
jgi:hypothetical protein